ncbi:hypothetical protein NW767_014334 [Fusarium falciforme]|nr:hypothetical protein NW767_014334 [Fusarium falciforme]
MGTYKPIRNPWSWHHLTNVVYIDQPIGTGFSRGNITATSEKDIAVQFMGFWKNFVDTFGLHGYKVYLTGESYAGLYCPYIGSAMLEAADTKYFDMDGMLIYDPVISDSSTQHVPVNNFVNYWSNVMTFNDTFRVTLANASKTCGFDDFVDKYLTFPPPGRQPDVKDMPGINEDGDDVRDECALFNLVFSATMALNPGFNVYQITQTLPVPDDVLGLPWTGFYVAEGRQIYFNRTDVKRAINAPLNSDWSVCSKGDVFVEGYDDSDPSIVRAIPHVIDGTHNVQISHGSMDFILVSNTTLLAIQNTTWGGKLGFQSMPESPLFVPQHPDPKLEGSSGSGVLGTFHTERGLTWSVVNQAGHMVPAYQAAVAYRQVQFMLRRIKSLDSIQPFPQYPDEPQPDAKGLGQGTGPL